MFDSGDSVLQNFHLPKGKVGRKLRFFVSHINSNAELVTEEFNSSERTVEYIEIAKVSTAFIHHVEISQRQRLASEFSRARPNLYLTKPASLALGSLLNKLSVPMTSFAGYHCFEYSLPTKDTEDPSFISENENREDFRVEQTEFEENGEETVENSHWVFNEAEVESILNISFAEALLKLKAFENEQLTSYLTQLQEYKGEELINLLHSIVSKQQLEPAASLEAFDDKNIFELHDWSVRAENVLRQQNINTVRDLRDFGPTNFLRVRNCGRKTVTEIRDFLKNLPQDQQIEKQPVFDASEPIDFKNWPLPVQESFRQNGINTINDLRLYSIQTLSGPGSEMSEESLQFVRDFASRHGFQIREKIMDPLPDFNLDNVITKTNTLKQDFDSLVSELDLRKTDMVKRRFGVDGPKHTLEDIAQDYGITRERVRQIVQKFWQRKMGRLRSLKSLEGKLSEIFVSDFHHEKASRITQDISEISDFFDCKNFYVEVIGKLNTLDLNIIEIDGEEYFANYDQESVQNIQTNVYNFLCESIGATKEDLFDAMEVEFGSSAGQAKIALENLLNYCIFRFVDNEQQLFEVRNRNSAGLQAAKVIFDSLEPLTAEDILENIAAQNNLSSMTFEITQRNIANQLAYFKGIYPMSHGTWGNIDHIPLYGEEASHVLEALEYFIQNRDEPQFHSRETIPHLPNFISDRIQDFHVSALIREYNLENYLGRNMFGPEGEERTHILDVIVEVLKEEGHPFTCLTNIRTCRRTSQCKTQRCKYMRDHLLLRLVAICSLIMKKLKIFQLRKYMRISLSSTE